MMKFCAPNCEHDIGFPHFAVVGKTFTFILCARCRHWAGRPAERCSCRAGCHSEARYGENEATLKTGSNRP